MLRLLLLVCVLTSCTFMLTQVITLYYFTDPLTPLRTSPIKHHSRLATSIQHLRSVCASMKLNMTLIDPEYLQSFADTEISHRRLSVHDHAGCHLLCRRSSITFLVDGVSLTKAFGHFVQSLKILGYVTHFEENYDQREVTLEHHGRTKLVNHVFAEVNNTLLHIVAGYSWKSYLWTTKCNLDTLRHTKWHSLAAKMSFCRSDYLLNHLKTTKALIDGMHFQVPLYVRTFLSELKNSTFTFCNYKQARSYYSMYGYDSSPESVLFRSKARKLLSTVIRLLGALKVRFWLSSGTCLGWFRQCDFIPHSKDVDIGIWITDYNHQIIPLFKKHGIVLKHLFGRLSDSFELSFQSGDMKLDIFFFYKDANIMWNGGTQARTGKKFKYIFPSFTLCWTWFNGLRVRIPCETLSYVKANYGEHWGEKVKTWDWKSSPPNVRENGEWPLEDRGEVIQSF